MEFVSLEKVKVMVADHPACLRCFSQTSNLAIELDESLLDCSDDLDRRRQLFFYLVHFVRRDLGVVSSIFNFRVSRFE